VGKKTRIERGHEKASGKKTSREWEDVKEGQAEKLRKNLGKKKHTINSGLKKVKQSLRKKKGQPTGGHTPQEESYCTNKIKRQEIQVERGYSQVLRKRSNGIERIQKRGACITKPAKRRQDGGGKLRNYQAFHPSGQQCHREKGGSHLVGGTLKKKPKKGRRGTVLQKRDSDSKARLKHRKPTQAQRLDLQMTMQKKRTQSTGKIRGDHGATENGQKEFKCKTSYNTAGCNKKTPHFTHSGANVHQTGLKAIKHAFRGGGKKKERLKRRERKKTERRSVNKG